MAKGLITACCVVLCCGGSDRALCQRSLSGSFEMSYVSAYVWRGIRQTSGSAFQPGVTISNASGLSASFWASRDSDTGEFREHDYTLNYSWQFGPAGLNAGYIHYAFPSTPFPSTSELYVSATLRGPLSPKVIVNCDLDEADGFYAALSTEYSYRLPARRLTVSPVPGSAPISTQKPVTCVNLLSRVGLGSANYNRYTFFGARKSAFTDLFLAIKVPFEVGNGWQITPSLNYTRVLDSALRSVLSANGVKADNFYLGLSLTRSL